MEINIEPLIRDVNEVVQHHLKKIIRTQLEHFNEAHVNFETLKKMPFVQKINKMNEELFNENMKLKNIVKQTNHNLLLDKIKDLEDRNNTLKEQLNKKNDTCEEVQRVKLVITEELDDTTSVKEQINTVKDEDNENDKKEEDEEVSEEEEEEVEEENDDKEDDEDKEYDEEVEEEDDDKKVSDEEEVEEENDDKEVSEEEEVEEEDDDKEDDEEVEEEDDEDKEVSEEEVEEEEVSEEEEDMEVFEHTIGKKTYYVEDINNGPVYKYMPDGDVGDLIGHLEKGKLYFMKEVM